MELEDANCESKLDGMQIGRNTDRTLYRWAVTQIGRNIDEMKHVHRERERERGMYMNLATFIILLILVVAVSAVVRKMIKDKKAGKGCAGCSGGCAGCSGSSMCHPTHGGGERNS